MRKPIPSSRSASRSAAIDKLAKPNPPSKPNLHTKHSLADQPRLADMLIGPTLQDGFTETPAPGQVRLVWGRSGDHASIYHMLLAVFQGPSRDEFHAQTEDPFYEPTDRLLVKRGFRVLSHLHLTRRTMHFGAARLPMSGFQWLATLPEFRRQGFATRLIKEAERRIAADGAVLGIVRTRVPRLFHRAGWALCGRHCFSQQSPACPRQFAYAACRAIRPPPEHSPLASFRNAGADTNSPAKCRDFVRRSSGPKPIGAGSSAAALTIRSSWPSMVPTGWIWKKPRPDRRLCGPQARSRRRAIHHARPSLGDLSTFARWATDVIERDRQDLVVHAPPEHLLHRLTTAAEGSYHHTEADQQEVFMVKVVDPPKFLTLLVPEFEARAKLAGLRQGTELGLAVAGTK